MSQPSKHKSSASTVLLWLILLAPPVGLLTYVFTVRDRLVALADWKVVTAMLIAWGLALYVFIRWMNTHDRPHGNSLP